MPNDTTTDLEHQHGDQGQGLPRASRRGVRGQVVLFGDLEGWREASLPTALRDARLSGWHRSQRRS
jgi:hypothetical protein